MGIALSTSIGGVSHGEVETEKEQSEVSFGQESSFVHQQKELETEIAKDTGLQEKSVKVILIPISAEKNTELACSIQLLTEKKLDEKTAEDVVEKVLLAVRDIENTSISEKHIVVTNANGEILY